jgi:hypothetical protein
MSFSIFVLFSKSVVILSMSFLADVSNSSSSLIKEKCSQLLDIKVDMRSKIT